MTKPKVSICIPTYNGEKYLRQCMDSCLSQSFTDFEVVVCDDGSSDSTVSIVESYVKSDSRVKLYRNEKNLGLVGNWNKCVELSQGEWIKFVFQDDFITQDCLEVFVSKIKQDIPLIVCKRNFVLDKAADEKEINYYKKEVRTLENTGRYTADIFTPATISKIEIDNLLLNFIAEPSLTLFKKPVINEVGLFDYDLKQICDLEFLLRIATKYGLVYIPQQLCSFRIHSDSTTEKNLTGHDYRIHYIEGLLFALKLRTKPAFEKFRQQLSFADKFKLALYIKYRTYKAMCFATTEEQKQMYENVKEEYGRYFYKSYEIPLMKLLLKIRS